MAISRFVAAMLALTFASMGCGADPTPTETTVIGPFTGPYAKLHPANISPHRIRYYGTDLGFTYEHQGKIELLFGDTNATEDNEPIEASTGAAQDDSFGSIDLNEWPDPDLITRQNIPLIRLGQHADSSEMSAINPGQPMEGFKTPLGGFSNGKREFGLFYTSKPKGCMVDADCGKALTCDTSLGYSGEKYDNPAGLTFGCIDGAPECNADTMTDTDGNPVAGSGLCTDNTASVWAKSPVGRTSSVAVTQLIGIRSTSDPRIYDHTHKWLTTKFANVHVRTVQDFEPGNDHRNYVPAGDRGMHRKVFLWGRPGFNGVAATGRSLGLYFAWVDMPAGPDFTWEPHYFAGTDNHGKPRFSTNEKDAVAVDLDSTRPGVQPEESIDLVNQISVAWVAHLHKWIMFYGGGTSTLLLKELPKCGVLQLFTGDECDKVKIGDGGFYMRSADNPWGPWSPPQELIAGGHPDADPLDGQYVPGGVLRHPRCTQANCVGHTSKPELHKDEYGFFYAANIIAQWIKPAGKGVNIIWNASTWDPYRIVLLRTHIDP